MWWRIVCEELCVCVIKLCVAKWCVWKIACDQVVCVCVSKIVCDKLYSLPPDAARAHCTLLSTTHETNQNCSRSCDLKASHWTLPWHVADCFIRADHRHVPGKTIAVAVILGWNPCVGPQHTRPRHSAPPAHEVTVTADNTISLRGTGTHVQWQTTKRCKVKATCKNILDARKTKVDVAKCHACHVKRRWMSPNGAQARHQSQPSATSATPATQTECRCLTVPRLPRKNESGCRQAQCLPREKKVYKCRLTAPKRATRASPVPQVPRLPRKESADVWQCHAYHAKRRWMSPSATPATWNEGGCCQVPHLPRKVPRRHGRLTAPKRATRASPVPQVPLLLRKRKVDETKVDVAKRQACHAKCFGVTGH